MAYDYQETVYDTTTDVKVLQRRIQVNFDALLRSFAGPDIPNANYQGTWWYDTTPSQEKMKFRSSRGWTAVFDVTNNTVVLGPGVVGTSNISDTARKGSIVQGQSIAPSACSIRSTSSFVTSMPSMSSTDRQNETSFSAPSTKTIMSQKVFLVAGITTIKMQFRAARQGSSSAQIQLEVSGSATGGWKSIGTGLSWYQSETSTGGRTGWADIAVKATVGSAGTVIHQGYGFCSNE